MKTVILTAAVTGELFTKALNADKTPKLDKNGKEFGTLRVENQATIDFAYAYNNGGVKRGQSALIAMTCEAWEKAKNFYKAGMEIPGRVRIVESLEAGLGFKPKMAGNDENSLPCTVGGQQIYRRTEFDPKGVLEDVLIAHDNADAISAHAKAGAVEAINAK